MVETVCPKCKKELEVLGASSLRCMACGLTYRVWEGIADLRYPPAEAADQEETRVAGILMSRYATSSFTSLLEIHFAASNTTNIPEKVLRSYQRRISNQMVTGSRLANMFAGRLAELYATLPGNVALEIGCGAGAGLQTLALSCQQVVGLDPSLPSLVLAKKYCEENHLDNVQLVQAYGQHLPFRNDTFSYATAQNTLEHVLEMEVVTREIARILRPAGCFVGDSRNRYDLCFPEPHVKLRWVGCFPRRWAGRYVKWRNGMNYAETHTRLLSCWELGQALRAGFGANWRIVLPKVSAYGAPIQIDAVLEKLERLQWIRLPLPLIFPSHLAMGRKQS
jgi:ubiquinone/menaquinone biosynthesis C-methylase UbiE/uncharacterized protein YbaR (Trm112 family)